jgi:hypothetical protein
VRGRVRRDRADSAVGTRRSWTPEHGCHPSSLWVDAPFRKSFRTSVLQAVALDAHALRPVDFPPPLLLGVGSRCRPRGQLLCGDRHRILAQLLPPPDKLGCEGFCAFVFRNPEHTLR